MVFKNLDKVVLETGNTTTDGSGEVTITLDCFAETDVPCIVVTPYDVSGNAVSNLTDIQTVGGLWTAKIITSAPNIKVRYHAFLTTAGSLDQINLITQDLFDILTQGGELILPQ